LLEEAALSVHEEEAWEEAEHQAQKEAWKAREVQEAQEAQEAARRRALEENEMNAHPKEDGDVVPNNTMDVDDGTVSPGKKKKKERVLVERMGDVRYKECVSRKAACLVEEAWVKKWKQLHQEKYLEPRAS